MGIMAYLGADNHMFDKTDTTCQKVELGMVAYLGAVWTLYVRVLEFFFFCQSLQVKVLHISISPFLAVFRFGSLSHIEFNGRNHSSSSVSRHEEARHQGGVGSSGFRKTY